MPFVFQNAKSMFSHDAAHIMLMCLSNALCYHNKYNLFGFIALFAANI